MQFIPAAMTWEVLSRGRWALATATVGVIALFTLILLAIRNAGPLDPPDAAIITMHFPFTAIRALLFGVAILNFAQSPLPRVYAYPVRTSTLVAGRMFPAMLIIMGQSLIATFVLNELFDLNWPLLGPALFLAVVVAWANATCWFMDKSFAWQVFFLSAVGAVLFTWFQWRDGFSSSPVLLWRNVTVADTLTMTAFAVAAYGVAVLGVARNRCGEQPVSLGVVDWMSRKFLSRGIAIGRSSTPMQAYFRSELRRKCWVMPVAVLLGLTSSWLGWLLFNRNPNDLMVGFLSGGGWLTLAGILGGIVMGNTGPSDSFYRLRQFTATLPISDQSLARTTLRATAVSASFAWLLWAVPFGLSYTAFMAVGAINVHYSDYPRDFQWWVYFPATISGIWSAATTVTAMGLTGKGKFWLRLVVVLLATFVSVVVVSQRVSSPESHDVIVCTLFGAIFVSIDGVTAGMFIVAHHRRLIAPALTWAIACAGVVVAAVAFLYWPREWRPYWLAALMIVAQYSLVVAPLATFPLAISANRHR